MVGAAQRIATDVTPDGILQLAAGFMAAKHLFVASEIDLFGQLAAGPATLDDLAERAGVPRRTARISTDAMVALGLVERSGDQYRNTPAAAAYLSGQGPADLRPILRFWNRISYPTWMHLEGAIRADQASNWQGGGFSEEDQRIFSEGVGAFAAVPAEALAVGYDFSGHRQLLDLGGGVGSFLLPALRRHAHLRGTLFELPGAAAVARQHLDREAEGKRVAVVAGDFFQDPVPTGHDAIIVANVVHTLAPERNRALFRRARGGNAGDPAADCRYVDRSHPYRAGLCRPRGGRIPPHRGRRRCVQRSGAARMAGGHRLAATGAQTAHRPNQPAGSWDQVRQVRKVQPDLARG